jgi:hypothetical protein
MELVELESDTCYSFILSLSLSLTLSFYLSLSLSLSLSLFLSQEIKKGSDFTGFGAFGSKITKEHRLGSVVVHECCADYMAKCRHVALGRAKRAEVRIIGVKVRVPRKTHRLL